MRSELGWIARLALAATIVIAPVVAWALLPPTQKNAAASGVWTCSMHPQVRQNQPGRCPICGMDLVPIEQLVDSAVSRDEQPGLQTEYVMRRELFKEIRTVGKLDFNERQVAFIAARIAGRVDRAYADFTGVEVKKGDHLVEIYSPDLVVSVQNLLDAIQNGNQVLADISRDRLRLWGVLPEQIREFEKSRKAVTHLTIHAPAGGTVIEKSVRAGQYVKEGDPLYRIADLDPIWLFLDVYEYDLAWIRFGQSVDVTLEAFPGEAFRGTVTFIDPFLDDRTRTVKARVNLKNPDRRLKPAMYATATIRVKLRADGTPEPTGLEGKFLCPMHPEVVREQPGKCPICEMRLEKVPAVQTAACHDHEGHDHGTGAAKSSWPLAVPVTAVLDTGARKVVYRIGAGGAYELVELKVGARAEGNDDHNIRTSFYSVLAGLKEGDRVVARGGFLLDSQRQIEGMASLLYPRGQSATNLHDGHDGSATPARRVQPAHQH